MGYGSWSDDAYRGVSAPRAKVDYASASTGAVFSTSLKPTLDPKGVKVRESRDSVDHPESNAIAVFFDVTGSMGEIPYEFAKERLGHLMEMLVTRGVIPHPQVLFGAIGDAHVDRVPFQVGQFESDVKMDQCLTDIFIERGGGGQNSESYGLAHYFVARHTSIDCFEKRGKKGYLFTLGDEEVWPALGRDEIAKIFGDTVQGGEEVKDLIAECQRRYEVFHIVVSTPTSQGHPQTLRTWRELLGERTLQLDDPANVCELIAATIGLCEGHSIDAVNGVLRDSGASAKAVASVGAAIVPLKDALARAGSGALVGDLPASGKSGGTVRV